MPLNCRNTLKNGAVIAKNLQDIVRLSVIGKQSITRVVVTVKRG